MFLHFHNGRTIGSHTIIILGLETPNVSMHFNDYSVSQSSQNKLLGKSGKDCQASVFCITDVQ